MISEKSRSQESEQHKKVTPIEGPLVEQSTQTNGQPLPETSRQALEKGFRRNFNSIRVHCSHLPVHAGKEMLSRGTDIHIAPDQFQDYVNPNGAKHELLWHEAFHVVQQGQGVVVAPSSTTGAAQSPAAPVLAQGLAQGQS
jgi:hypothetical protein